MTAHFHFVRNLRVCKMRIVLVLSPPKRKWATQIYIFKKSPSYANRTSITPDTPNASLVMVLWRYDSNVLIRRASICNPSRRTEKTLSLIHRAVHKAAVHAIKRSLVLPSVEILLHIVRWHWGRCNLASD
jgi:hypothetical protein